MSASVPRRRASTLKSAESGWTDLQGHLKTLTDALPDIGERDGLQNLHIKIQAAHCIRRALLESSTPNEIKDAFRRLNGFQALVLALRSISQQYGLNGKATEKDQALFDLAQIMFGLLAAALQHHTGNQKYFRTRVDGGGWEAIKRLLMEILLLARQEGRRKDRVPTETLFGCLLACAVNDETMVGFFGRLRRELCCQDQQGLTSPQTDEVLNSEKTDLETIIIIQESLHKELGPSAFLHNPEIIPVMLELWGQLEETSHAVGHSNDVVSLAIPKVVSCLAALSTHCLLAMHAAGVLSTLLTYLLNPTLSKTHISELRSLAILLLKLGIHDLNDAYFLYRKASSSPLIADFLLLALQESHSPPYIHFDLSLHGFASVELPNIGRSFPPLSSSAGYTFTIWLHIVKFDPNSHTTLFGAFDSSQTCFVLVYLEKETRHLILQTSISSTRPSVRFKSIVFQENRWYHVCLVHRRQKATMSSRASLFIDGEFIEQVKSHYPLAPPPVGTPSESTGSVSSSYKSNPVQAFLGTPQDLASRLGKGLVSSQWRLASAQLFADTLSDDLIAVYNQLGPKYNGNYQDCLGSFQTYSASATLNLRNESLHPGKEERSDIVSAIRSKASDLLPESKVLLNISPVAVLYDDEWNKADETQLVKSLSKLAIKNLRNVTRGGRNAVAINGAVPSVNEALLHSFGFAVLTGDPAVIVPQLLDDAAWRIGGCAAVGLALLETARTQDAVIRALKTLFETVEESWRNSEAMERENGFGVLASLLAKAIERSGPLSISLGDKANPDTLALEALKLVLKFVGYRSQTPEDSVINNPLAYRVLLVDLDVWRNAAAPVQELYYQQFTVLGVSSKYHHFNTKRLLRMRIVKKWLDALKGESFLSETFDYFMEAFRSLLTRNLSAEALRSLALYITYACHKPRQRTLQLPQSMRRSKHNLDTVPRRATLLSSSPNTPVREGIASHQLTQLQTGTKILEMYAEMLCQRNDNTNIKKFARTVTNKWLLHLITADEPAVVILATKILARLIVVNGSSYMKKFVEKTGGVTIMQHRLKRWWNVPTIWRICFAIMFGQDVALIDFDRHFNLFSLLESFAPDGKIKITYPEILPVLTAMLHNGLETVGIGQRVSDSPLAERCNGSAASPTTNPQKLASARSRSASLNTELSPSGAVQSHKQWFDVSPTILQTVTRFLADIHTKIPAFRDFTLNSTYVQELLFVLFSVVVSPDPVSPTTELNSRDSALTFNGTDVVIRPLSQVSMKAAPVVRTASSENPQRLLPTRAQPPRRMSSYILITSEESQHGPSPAKLQPAVSPSQKAKVGLSASNSIVEELLEIVIAVFSDQIFVRKDFAGLGLFMKVPPGFQEHQAYFESFLLRNTLSHLGNTIRLNRKLLWEPRVLTNLARFATHLREAVYEGWFIDGAGPVLDFLGDILEYLRRPDISALKSTRLCSQIISTVRTVVLRVILLRLSELNESISTVELLAFLDKLVYWQTVLITTEEKQEEFSKLFFYLLYTKVISTDERVRTATINLWRMILVQEPNSTFDTFHQAMTGKDDYLFDGFKKLIELDNETFLAWVDDHRERLDEIFFGSMSKAWEVFVAEENRRTEETAKARIVKRRDKLKVWQTEHLTKEDVLRRHEISSEHWGSNIYASEYLKRQRATQDHQDNQIFNNSTWTKMSRELHRPCGLFDDLSVTKWQLDQTEGRNRMRLRFVADKDAHLHDYQPKGKQIQGLSKTRNSLRVRKRVSAEASSLGADSLNDKGEHADTLEGPLSDLPQSTRLLDETPEQEDDFEMVDDPREEAEDYEDKNRKVMRSLQRGDQVEHVHNVSRIVGLEACEGLLILGKISLYLLDNLFQRSDGEIVNVWQAPQEERDSYLQLISGREAGERGGKPPNTDHETRSWRWDDVLSISKRRFLFRDVALEIFFIDGRSYLLTTGTPELRDQLYQKLLSKAPSVSDPSRSATREDSWRIEFLRTPEDNSQSLGSRFTSVFGHGSSNPATRKWIKGEISNFHYLMLVNTMAGRTFNDLTQYPVFPWVLADYTSEEMDLTNPQSFRDLTKPMGCQNPEREAEFRDRYHSFAEMGDQDSPPFHYGTHYSSAMIVTSYLIRLQPFVQSYLLLQGGSFDHPDRLFYSIEKAWSSASRDNMTDVRELTPEFYYLPEFLVNSNEYDFGSRQGSGGAIDTVILPPWAKGDPKVFIAKHREALESEHVSRHLHNWIDLVFGHKQRGEAALDATNVFHHLSYHGAKDLDAIDDPVERLATIGIIHNFGQTPHQVFQRAHPQREEAKHKLERLETTAESLTRLPFPILENRDRVTSLQYSWKHDRLLCSEAFRLNIAPAYDKYMEWGFVDGSVRFYMAESKKLISLFEHVHQGQLSYALFADSRTLITAGTDCTISIWAVISDLKSVDLQPKICLFGHRSSVTMLAVSRSFSALLSASSDGQVLLWDLNRLEFVRKLTFGKPVECARINDVTGIIMLCRGSDVSLFTLNGDLLLEQNVCVEGDDTIISCAFYEGSGSEYLERELIFTGHKRGVINIWSNVIRDGNFVLEHVKRMNHLDPAGFNVSAAMTCILPMAQVVYTGDEDGRVYEWDCIQRHDGR